MAKFPINFVLYTTSLGLLGASGWQFYEAYRMERKPKNQKVAADLTTGLKRGADSVGTDGGGPNYTERAYDKFRTANFIGRKPKKPVVDDGPKQVDVRPPVSQTPLEEIMLIRCVYFESNGKSRIVVEYKPEANIQPPPEVIEARQAANDRIAAAPRSVGAAARGRRGRGARGNRGNRPTPTPATPMPTTPGSGSGSYSHLLELEDKLWKPYDSIRLVDVAVDATHAIFVRDDPQKKPEELPREKLFQEVLGLDQDLLNWLHSGRAASNPTEPVPVQSTPTLSSNSAWQPGPQTRKVGTNQWHLGEEPLEQFQGDPSRIFNEAVGLQSYQSKYATGVKVTRVSPKFSNYGIQEEDVLISINGQAVRSKAEAVRVGKRLYRSGVRTFKAMFLSRGRKVERTYVAPNK